MRSYIRARAHLIDRQSAEPAIILVDLLLLNTEFSGTLQARRVSMTIAGKQRWVCSAEDLIVLKLISGRVKDIEDVRGIRRIQHDAIDTAYIDDWAERLNCQENWRKAHG